MTDLLNLLTTVVAREWIPWNTLKIQGSTGRISLGIVVKLSSTFGVYDSNCIGRIQSEMQNSEEIYCKELFHMIVGTCEATLNSNGNAGILRSVKLMLAGRISSPGKPQLCF